MPLFKVDVDEISVKKQNLWTVEFAPFAIESFKKMGRHHAALLMGFISKQLHEMPNPRAIGKPLKCYHSHMWRYRIGDYRLACQLDQKRLVVIVILIDRSFIELIEMTDELDIE